MDWLKSLAPTLGTALLGPLGGVAAEFIADKLGASDKTVDGIKSLLSGMKPEDTIKLKQMDLDFQKFMAENNIKIQLAQIDVNKAEATSTNWFVAGWRPAVGWIGAFGLLYAAMLEPLARFVAQVGFHYAGAFPALDTTITMQVLFGILGLGVYRTAEKIKGAEGNR